MVKKSQPQVVGARGLTTFIALSVWEIAHRWHNLDPNATDPKNLPLPVQDTLRTLCQDLVTQTIPASNRIGDDYRVLSDLASNKAWKALVAGADQATIDAAREQFTQEHRQAVAGLEVCAEQRLYDRDKLDSVYVSIFALERFCKHNHLPKPEFWFLGDETEVIVPPRREQLDKAVCQGIARTIWEEHPALTIQALIKHPAIQKNGNGAHYTEKTLRGWLSEVDPRAPEEKTGRPSKPKQSQ